MEGLHHEARVARWMIIATLLCWLALGTISYAGLPFADWVQVAGNGVRSARVAADSDGNCFVVGTFGKYSSNGEISFGDTTLVTRGLDDVFVAKYDSNGQVQWVRQLGGLGSDSATALAVDSQGNCIVAGLFQLMAQFGNTNITAVGTDAFVAKMKPDGTVSWVNSVGSPVGTAVVTIAVAKRDDLIIGGGVQISASFGSTNIYGPSFFLCRYDSAGETRWLVATSGVRSAQVSGVAVDANDNLLAVGGFSGPIVIGDTTLQHSLNSSGLFLAKYNPAGQVVWARAAGEGDAFAGRIALDPRGYIAVAARFGNDGYTIGDDILGPHSSSGTYSFVSRFTPEGIPLWARQFGGAGSTFSGCNGLCADRSGNIYATGYFSGTATFGSHLISGTVFDYHVYLIKYDSSGDLQWVRANGGEGGSNMSAVSLDENDQIFWAGLFSSSIEIGDITVTASNAEPSLFVSRLQLNAKLSSRAEMGKLVLDWPTNLTDFTLQSAADPTTHELWKPVPLEPIRSGNRFVITNSLEESNLFFRLESR